MCGRGGAASDQEDVGERDVSENSQSHPFSLYCLNLPLVGASGESSWPKGVIGI